MNRVLNSPKKKLYFPLYFILILIIVGNIFIMPVHSSGVTVVSVDPSTQTIPPGGSFSIDVNCVPSQPIRSFEMKISFNPSLLQATSVTEGDIFQEYTTFFNPGSIDNSGGTIEDIYDLILGTGEVSSSGTFITVSFLAKSVLGTSAIDLVNVGVANNTGYVPIVVSDGSVTIQETNHPPVYTGQSPINRSINVPITTASLGLIIRDPDGDHFNYTIQTRPSVGSVSVKNAVNGTKSCSISGLTYSTTYRWYVNATDGHDWTRRWYTFTTASPPINNPPVFSGMTPSNGSINIPISTSSISLTIRDPEGKSFNYTIQTRPNVGSVSVKNAINGTKSCTISGLTYSTTYRWYVNATDGHSWTRRWYIFTTQHNPMNDPVVFSGVTPDNASLSVPLTTSSLMVIIQDAEGDAFTWRITTTPNIGSHSGTNEFNGSKTCSIAGLAYNTTYHWFVSCSDVGSGQWVNRSYWFTTEADSSGGGSPGGGSGGNSSPGGNGSTNVPPPNNPPNSPLKPIGPTFIERGVTCTYTSSAIDPDGDQVRLRFNWGDGNFSNWSEFMDSNTTASSSHTWNSLSNYSIRVLAQDKNGSNSSWSTPLTVTVSEQETSNESPILDIKATNNGFVNQTIVFDASGSIDPDGIIISYIWDFGDGTTGTGKTLDHSYTKPGIYLITLTVTDNTGNTFIKIIQVTINANAEATIRTTLSSSPYLIMTFIFIVCALSIVTVFFFRKKVRDVLSIKSTGHHMKKIEQLNTKNAKVTQNFSIKPNYKKSMSKEQKQLELYDPSFEDKIDRIVASKIEEKIDNM